MTGVKEPVHGATPDNNFTVGEKGLTQTPNASGWLDVEARKSIPTEVLGNSMQILIGMNVNAAINPI